jgi:hypothetical protein
LAAGVILVGRQTLIDVVKNVLEKLK